jgi:hypothetical protein
MLQAMDMHDRFLATATCTYGDDGRRALTEGNLEATEYWHGIRRRYGWFIWSA